MIDHFYVCIQIRSTINLATSASQPLKVSGRAGVIGYSGIPGVAEAAGSSLR